MITIDIRYHQCIKIYGEAAVDLFVEFEDVGDTETNGTTMANYVIKVGDSYGDYKITEKHYYEGLTIKQTKECDEYLAKLYEQCYFEQAYIEAINEDELDWFI
jgi:hypothetical protein